MDEALCGLLLLKHQWVHFLKQCWSRRTNITMKACLQHYDFLITRSCKNSFLSCSLGLRQNISSKNPAVWEIQHTLKQTKQRFILLILLLLACVLRGFYWTPGGFSMHHGFSFCLIIFPLMIYFQQKNKVNTKLYNNIFLKIHTLTHSELFLTFKIY